METERYNIATLPNGIRLLHKRKSGEIAHLVLVVGTGSRDELESQNGMAHFIEEDGGFTVKCQPNDFTTVLEAIKAGGINVDEENSAIGLVPNMMNPVADVAAAKAINKFVEMLEDLEDVHGPMAL